MREGGKQWGAPCIEEYSKYDKDLKLLTFKLLLEKFNDKYKDLLPEQKNILKEFITSVNSQSRLRTLVNEEMNKIASAVRNLTPKVKDEVIKIKLDEVSKNIKPLTSYTNLFYIPLYSV